MKDLVEVAAPNRGDGSPFHPAISPAFKRATRYESTVSTHHVNLTPQENSLIDQAHPTALDRMDEKSLKDLQSRLRKAREKNFSLLRRQGAARVEAEGARGAAQPANEKRNEKVDVFDEALARVAERLEAIDATE